MSRARTFALAIIWGISLLGVGLWAEDGPTFRTPEQEAQSVPPAGAIAGADLVFVPSMHPNQAPGTISGQFMVRRNGRWLRVTPGPMSIQPAHH